MDFVETLYIDLKHLSTGDKLNLSAISWHFKKTISNAPQMGSPQLPWESSVKRTED
jgi:hypothetical protein